MAIYHFSAQVISRSQGRSAVAAAAYRSGERLIDEQTGEIKEYSREVQPETMILAPEHSPEWVQDRQQLWNEVEAAERRKDAQLCREVNIALPKELSNQEQRELIRDFAQEQFVNKGMVADIAIHRDDQSNPHAHIMLTTREINEQGFGNKNRDWNKKEQLEEWREQWANHANKSLEKAHIPERITHLSHEARGLETLPTVHVGHKANQLEKAGIQTERGEINRTIQEHNAVVKDLQEYRVQKADQEQWKHFAPKEKADVKQAAQLMKTRVTLPKIDERLEQINKWEQRIGKSESYLNWKENTFQNAQINFDRIEYLQRNIEHETDRLKNATGFNRLKVWESKHLKFEREASKNNIERYQKEIQQIEKKLEYPREKLGFTTKEQFYEKYQEFRKEKTIQSNTNFKQKGEIKEQREVLTNAKTAFKNAEIRRIADKYPNWEARKYLTYEGAKTIESFNEQFGKQGKVISIESIERNYNAEKERRSGIQKQLEHINHEGKRLQNAEKYLNQYEKAQSQIEKMESTLGKTGRLFGKLTGNHKTENQYQEARNNLEYSKQNMKEYGVENRQDFNQQKAVFDQKLAEKPNLEKSFGQHQKGFDIVSNVMEVINQAARKLETERFTKEYEKQYKPKNHYHERTRERER